jgi:pimeloyl-ACP methyl ester carboxylesterase
LIVTKDSISFTRRHVLATSGVVSAFGFAGIASPTQVEAMPADDPVARPAKPGVIRPFRARFSATDLGDLRRRVLATRWPEKETVSDHSQGAQLARVQALAQYWAKHYDWRKAEAKLNALPQFKTEIDGLDIHFIHVRSKHAHAMPLLMTHGWPGSVFEMLKMVGPLTDPTAHGGTAEDAFHLVLPSYPGYGFSQKPHTTGWGPDRVARAFHELMQHIGYRQYVSQGGDWGAIISEVLALQAPEGLRGIHINMPGTVPAHVLKLIQNREAAPSHFSTAEKTAFAGLEYFYRKGFGYAEMMNTRPQTLGYSLADSPVGMLAFYYDKFSEWTHSMHQPEKVVSFDDMLDNVTLYWLTNTGTSSSRSYWDAAQLGGGPFNAFDITKVPVAVTVFPGEIYRAPRSWGEQAFKKLIHWNEVDRGGHFAAWEEPLLLATELRAAFKSLR